MTPHLPSKAIQRRGLTEFSRICGASSTDAPASRFEAVSLIVIAALLRLVPHPYNFAPIGGVSLLSGAKLNGWQSYAVPLMAMLATDPILSYFLGYPAFSWGTPVVYLSFLIYVLLGKLLLKAQPGPLRISAAALLGSVQFFVLTNLAVWWRAGGMYPHTPAGLAECYVAALPFLGRTVLGDLFYAGVFFTVYQQLHQRARRTVLGAQ